MVVENLTGRKRFARWKDGRRRREAFGVRQQGERGKIGLACDELPRLKAVLLSRKYSGAKGLCSLQ